MMVTIKSVEIFHQLMAKTYAPLLIEVALDVIHILEEMKIKAVVTSAHRPGDKGVHGTDPGRGLDFRTWDMTEDQANDICDQINAAWTYDDMRPHMKVAMYHDIGRGPHLHLQVHPRTIKS